MHDVPYSIRLASSGYKRKAFAHEMLRKSGVVSNMNSITEAFSPLSRVSPAFVIVGWTKRVALRRLPGWNSPVQK